MIPPIRVSDHALKRWLQRTGALDLDAVRAALEVSLTRAASAAQVLQQSQYLIAADDLLYVVRKGVVVTVLHDDSIYQQAKTFLHPGSEPPAGQ